MPMKLSTAVYLKLFQIKDPKTGTDFGQGSRLIRVLLFDVFFNYRKCMKPVNKTVLHSVIVLILY